MYCQHCGKQIRDGVRFCTFCGLRQELDVVEPIGDMQVMPTQAEANVSDPPLSVVSRKEAKRRRSWAVPGALLVILSVVVVASFGAWRLGLLDGVLFRFSEALSNVPIVSELLPDGQGSKDDVAEDIADEVPRAEAPEENGGRQSSADDATEGVTDEVTRPRTPEEYSEAAERNEVPNENVETSDTDANDTDDGVEVRASLSDYSWEELGQIAHEIELCMTAEEAQSVAKRYNLLDQYGSYKGSTKDVRLSDGKTIHMKLVGVWHDNANTSSSKAGLTFLSDGIVSRRVMHSKETVSGGWEASDMRSWLSSAFKRMLPEEVASVIIPVRKLTNNLGKTKSTSSVSETWDEIWLPSVVELCGPVSWVHQIDSGNSDLYNSVINSEGSQFPAFAQQQIDDFSGNTVLSLGGQWWLRSTSPGTGKGRYVDSNGDPSYYGEANLDKGVVIGFCL